MEIFILKVDGLECSLIISLRNFQMNSVALFHHSHWKNLVHVLIRKFFKYQVHIQEERTLKWVGFDPKSVATFDSELFWTPKPKGFGFCCWNEVEFAPNPKAFDFGCCWVAWANLHLSPYWQLTEPCKLKV